MAPAWMAFHSSGSMSMLLACTSTHTHLLKCLIPDLLQIVLVQAWIGLPYLIHLGTSQDLGLSLEGGVSFSNVQLVFKRLDLFAVHTLC